MSKVAIVFTDGVEEIEGLTVVDLVRRAKIQIDMISIKDIKTIEGSHGISFQTDMLYKDADMDSYDMLVLPGGPGTQNLKAYKPLHEDIIKFNAAGKNIAAICAAPTVFGMLGLLEGKNACSYESCEEGLIGAKVLRDEVVTDGNITTSRGVGTAIAFALRLVELLKSKEEADALGKSIMYKL